MNSEINKTFALYANKTESDYYINVNGLKLPTQTTLTRVDENATVTKSDNLTVYRNEFIQKLSPDNIDSREFWKMATNNFPLFSICGGIQDISTKHELNAISVLSAKSMGCLGILKSMFEADKNTKMLEIGPGHGGIKNFIAESYGDDNYWAIDVNPLFNHPRIFQTDGKNIPDTIPNPLDIVYSVNVFQHLSKKQRTSYYRQIFEVLKVGGVFVFGMYTMTPLNSSWPCWGTKGEDGKFYCHFFRQFTEIDMLEDLETELDEIGFSVQILNDQDKTHYLTFKCVKLTH